MERNKKKKQVYKSIREFRERFFPKSFRKKSKEVPTDARAIGISLAKKSLDMIRRQLVK